MGALLEGVITAHAQLVLILKSVVISGEDDRDLYYNEV
jgi:hypothetical protein